jgi:hypothetical protein
MDLSKEETGIYNNTSVLIGMSEHEATEYINQNKIYYSPDSSSKNTKRFLITKISVEIVDNVWNTDIEELCYQRLGVQVSNGKIINIISCG